MFYFKWIKHIRYSVRYQTVRRIKGLKRTQHWLLKKKKVCSTLLIATVTQSGVPYHSLSHVVGHWWRCQKGCLFFFFVCHNHFLTPCFSHWVTPTHHNHYSGSQSCIIPIPSISAVTPTLYWSVTLIPHEQTPSWQITTTVTEFVCVARLADINGLTWLSPL